MLGSPGVARERVLSSYGALQHFRLRCCRYRYCTVVTVPSPQRFRKEIALQDQQIFGNRLVVGHVRDAGQRQERVLTSGCISAWLRRRLCAIVTLSSANPWMSMSGRSSCGASAMMLLRSYTAESRPR